MNQPRLHVLIVDDSPEDRATFRRYLAPRGHLTYRFTEAESGEEGLRLCRADRPDCVLLDYSLPDLDGLEFLIRLAAELGEETVPVVMLTGKGNEAVAVEALKRGAEDYLIKGGLASDGIRQAVQAAIDKAVLRRALDAHRRELERNAEALQEAGRLTATIANNASLGLFMLDARQHCTFMNPAAEQITGFRLDEVQDKPLHDFVHHSRPNGTPYPIEECPIDRALPTRARERGEDVFVHKDGHFYPVAYTASPILSDGRPVGTVVEVRDTTEEREVERRLRSAVAARDEFLSVASHELRTPLTALGLQLERLKHLVARIDTDGDRPKAEKTLAVAVRQVERLEVLIEGLLNVSRITSGRMQLHLQAFDLRDLVRDTVERLSELAARAGCAIRIHMDEPVIGTWDHDRLDEVVINLLTNAIKYGPRKPIDVTVAARDDTVTLAVRDQGIGIAPEAQRRIFGRFERAVSTSNYGGLGLGLFITRQIVEAHGGDIAVESTPGAGATFTVNLPRVAAERSLAPSAGKEA